MKLTMIARDGNCIGSNCPTVYLSDRGTVVIQGDRVSDAGIDIPDHEVLAEIPLKVLEQALRSGAL